MISFTLNGNRVETDADPATLLLMYLREELGLTGTKYGCGAAMCGACMVPVSIEGKLIRKHACIDGPEIDSHIIDWDKFLPRFLQFKAQETRSLQVHGFA